MAMPIAAKTMWNASDIAIWARAAARSLTGARESSDYSQSGAGKKAEAP
jgi:hypothetical protein